MQNKHVAIKVCMGILIPVCIVVGAALGAWMARTDISGLLIALPFIPTALLFRYIASADRLVEAFVLLGVVALLTFIYPVVRSIKAKKFSRRFFLWFLPAIFAALTVFSGLEVVFTMIFAIAFYLTLILCLLVECNAALNADSKRSFKYIRLILCVLIILNVLSVFFVNPYNISDNMVESNYGMSLHACLKFVLDIVAFVINMSILYLGLNITDTLKGDIYDPDTIGMLGKLTKKCKVSIVYSLLAAVFLYVSMLLFALMGGTVTYSFDFSLISLLTVCLVIIFAGILKRSIAEHEENKLTI